MRRSNKNRTRSRRFHRRKHHHRRGRKHHHRKGIKHHHRRGRRHHHRRGRKHHHRRGRKHHHRRGRKHHHRRGRKHHHGKGRKHHGRERKKPVKSISLRFNHNKLNELMKIKEEQKYRLIRALRKKLLRISLKIRYAAHKNCCKFFKRCSIKKNTLNVLNRYRKLIKRLKHRRPKRLQKRKLRRIFVSKKNGKFCRYFKKCNRCCQKKKKDVTKKMGQSNAKK